MELFIIFPQLQWVFWGKTFTRCWSQWNQHPTALCTEHTTSHRQVKWGVLRQYPKTQEAHSHEVSAPTNNCLRRTCKKNADSFADFRDVSFKIRSRRLWSTLWEWRKKPKSSHYTKCDNRKEQQKKQYEQRTRNRNYCLLVYFGSLLTRCYSSHLPMNWGDQSPGSCLKKKRLLVWQKMQYLLLSITNRE